MRDNRGVSAPYARRNGINAVRGLLLSALLLITIVAMLNVGQDYGPVGNASALDPHIITGSVYEANASTCNNCNVTITNARTGESSSGVTSNATGVYAYNLLNLPSGWAYGDTVQVSAQNSTGSNGTNSTTLTIGTVSTTIDVWIGTSQVTAGVNFYIIDEDGAEVNGAMVNIKDSSGDIVTTKVTDSDGKASTTLSNGLYTVTVSKSGYDDVVKTIRVHGCTYTIQLAGEEVVGVTTADLWYWVLIIFAVICIIAILGYIIKKH